MKLHDDQDAFLAILQLTNELTGIRADILEKDYYVTLVLKELADKQNVLPAFFKGGTALYKALGTIRRFSEDIDLTVRVDDCSSIEARQRLVEAAQGYRCLPRSAASELEYDYIDSISSVFQYKPLVDYLHNDPLQRFSQVRIEASSYTISEPTESRVIAPVILEYATEEQKAVLDNQYDVAPFSIETIRIERIFIDKIFASEYYYSKETTDKKYLDVAKHIYDIAVMSKLDVIKTFLQNVAYLNEIISFKRREESGWKESDLDHRPFREFITLRDLEKDNNLETEYSRMQDIYIFDDSYRIEYRSVCSTLTEVLGTIINLVGDTV